MTRKVTIEVRTKLLICIDEGVEVSEVMDEMDYDYSDMTGKADVENCEILDYEITDSR